MHAGHLLVLSGVLLVLAGPWPWNTSWVIATLVILLVSSVYLSNGFTKVLRRYHMPTSDKEEILTVLTENIMGLYRIDARHPLAHGAKTDALVN